MLLLKQVVGIKGETGSGKTMKTPQFVYEHFLNSDVTRNPSILLVEKAIYSAEKVVESLVDVFWVEPKSYTSSNKQP